MVACIPPKNQVREPKKIPYVVPIYELGMPPCSSCEYSSTPSILGIEEEVVHPWEIDVAVFGMIDVRECKLGMTQTTARLKTIHELMAEGYLEGNSQSTLNPRRLSVEFCTTSTSTSVRGGEGCSTSSYS